MSEFDMIARYFAPLTMGRQGLDNDTASIAVPEGHELAVSTDTLNEGVHFFVGTPADVIARKALRSNLSDLIASGAEPLCYQLALAFPQQPSDDWLQAFTQALLDDQTEAGLYCSGGDTTSTKGPLSITITVMGLVPRGDTITRSGAQAGDVALLTGPVGLAHQAFLAQQTYVPPLRATLAPMVQRYASAAIDVSDGFLADAGHIVRASGLDLQLRADDIPHEGALLEAVTGGDDYEILMAVPADHAITCLNALAKQGLTPAIIGEFRPGTGQVQLLDAQGSDITPEKAGWQHF